MDRCGCGGEVYYCEDYLVAFSRSEVKERRITDSVRHHGHDHADCLLCGKELCDEGHMEVCQVEPTES
jgi:hypothetical protein